MAILKGPATPEVHERAQGAMEAFLSPRLEKVGGGKDLKESVEAALRCAALADKEAEPTRSWLTARAGAR